MNACAGKPLQRSALHPHLPRDMRQTTLITVNHIKSPTRRRTGSLHSGLRSLYRVFPAESQDATPAVLRDRRPGCAAIGRLFFFDRHFELSDDARVKLHISSILAESFDRLGQLDTTLVELDAFFLHRIGDIL